MEEYTNKYMQVFDTYDQFAQNSANYVKGEDHIAYLIQENEVIYWLYLEQVWRPLNVRTTTTGQLEDGRSKVAVRLEYVEGGQKYTSVPNIPDPERITSMSHFLEDYPDIEEVNVTGTVNLTDLSYAFAGSKIRDFSKLDTSKVRYAYNLLQNVNDESLIVNFSSADSCYANYIVDGATLNEFNWIEGYGDTNARLDEHIVKGIAYKACKINKFNIPHLFNNYDNTFREALSITVYTNNIITELIAPYIKIVVYNENLIPKDVKLSSIKGQYVLFNLSNSNDKNVVLKGNDLYIEAEDIEFKYNSNVSNENGKIVLRNYCTPKHSLIVNNNYAPPRFNFGGGIKIENDKEIVLGDNLIKNKTSIGNFIFTTPIVDDAFYAKYNHPISIFQYKTTFTEVADVKITEATDSSLIHVDWGSIDFDTNEMSVEIHNVVNAEFRSFNKTFKKLILDNVIEQQEDFNNYPLYDITSYRTLSNDGFISGFFKTIDPSSTNVVYENKLLKNATIYQANDTVIFRVNYGSNIFSEERNVKIIGERNINVSKVYGNYINPIYFDIYTLIENNIFNANVISVNFDVSDSELYFKYYPNIELHLGNKNDFIRFYEYFKYSTRDNPIYIDKDITLVNDMANGIYSQYKHLETIENVYIQCTDNAFIKCIDGSYTNGSAREKSFANNFIGVINLELSRYKDSFIIVDNNIKHIDINKTKADAYNNSIVYYQSCDEETLINLITKLIDNTSSSSAPTIYMYRSQANIIGDDNIAAAVAKNYEFAIIEN